MGKAAAGAAQAGRSSGRAMEAMQAIADKQLSADFGIDWTGISYQERLSGGQEASAFLFGWSSRSSSWWRWMPPLSVMLAFASLGGLVALLLQVDRHHDVRRHGAGKHRRRAVRAAAVRRVRARRRSSDPRRAPTTNRRRSPHRSVLERARQTHSVNHSAATVSVEPMSKR
jgi:hypothetical protein